MKNTFIEVLKKTILLYAGIHSVFMVLYALSSGAYETLNGFRILGFNLFFPTIDQGIVSFFISWGFLLSLFCFVYIFGSRKKNN